MTKANTARKTTATDLDEVPSPPAAMPTLLSRLHPASEAPKSLGLQVRKSDDTLGLAELEASVRAHGIIVPMLYVVHNGICYVTAGNRRLKVLRAIYGDIDVAVPAIDATDFTGDSREIAMATNIALPPHPVDRFEVIKQLVDEGMLPEDAQARFAMTGRQFAQVMKLAALSPVIRDKWRSGEIAGDVAQAFALEPDMDEQEKVLATAVRAAWQGRIHAHDVTLRILGKQHDVGRLVNFVGIDACRMEGILKQEDLFSNHHTVTDIRRLQKMAEDALAAAARDLIENGWSWAIPAGNLPSSQPEYMHGRIEPSKKSALNPTEKAAIEQLKEASEDHSDAIQRIESGAAQRGYTAEQRAKSGCILKIGQNGELVVDYGRVAPSDKRKVAVSTAKSKKKPAAGKKEQQPAITNALVERMSTQLTMAVKKTIVASPAVAVAAMLGAFASNGHVLDVKLSNGDYSTYDPKKQARQFVDVFESARKSTPEQLVSMMASVAGIAVNLITHNAQHLPLDDIAAKALVDSLNPHVFREKIAESFDLVGYLESVPVATIASAVGEVMGKQDEAAVRKMRKSDAVKFAHDNFAGIGWLPEQLRPSHYQKPKFLVRGAVVDAKVAAKKKTAPKKVAKKGEVRR